MLAFLVCCASASVADGKETFFLPDDQYLRTVWTTEGQAVIMRRLTYSIRFLVFVPIILCVVGAAAQYRIDHWTADDGLPQNSVYGIVQTRDGYLWLATVDGLARFDGVRFTIFNKSNSPGIVSNRFISVFEAGNGDLWAGTEESGGVRLRGGRFEHYGADAGVPRGVSWIETDASGEGTIFHGGNHQTVVFQNGKFSPIEARANFPSAGRNVRSSSIQINCIFAAENNFSECFIDGQWNRFSLFDETPSVWQTSAAQETNGDIWLITGAGRLARVENGAVARIYDERDGLPQRPLFLMTGSRLALVARDADGALWLVDLPSMRKELLLEKAAVPPPLAEPEVFSAHADGEGNLWFGTLRDGLFRARKQIITAYSEADGIAEKNVYPIYEDRAGTIWIGATGGLSKYENGTFARLESTKNFYVSSIGEDALGRILIGNFGVLYVQENNQFVPFEREKIPAVNFIYAIHADRAGALWIGGENGLMRFEDGVLTKFTTADGLAGNDVKVIVEAQTGGLWVGTYDGLTRIENGQFTSWREADGLPSRTVRALYEEADGTLWIGSYDGGLARFKDGKFTRYDTKTGLPNDGAFQILEDDNRNFWISSNRGIYRVGKDELNDFADGRRANVTAIAYGKADGMLNAECNGGRSPAGIRASDGHLWFPTQDGVAVIDPETVKVNPKPPPVVIETIKIDNNDSEFDKEKSKINIEPAQNNFEIGYTALSFVNSENLQFKYKLEGLDDEWIDAGTRRLAYFSHVPPGSYTFRVIAANSDNVWNEEGATLKIVVIPAFYQTWWFVVLCAFAVTTFAFLIYRRRLSEIRRRQFAQEEFSRRLINAHETERRRIAAELHDGLGHSLAMIKNSAVAVTEIENVPPPARRQLEQISEQTANAIGEVREISYNLRPFLLDYFGLTKAIKSLLNRISETTLIEIDAEIDEIDDLFGDEVEMSIYRIVQESLNNVLKHANADKVSVAVKRRANLLTIIIDDDGKGFDQTAESINSKPGGFGLLGIAERVRMLGGTHSIKSSPGKGTTVNISIELNEKRKDD